MRKSMIGSLAEPFMALASRRWRGWRGLAGLLAVVSLLVCGAAQAGPTPITQASFGAGGVNTVVIAQSGSYVFAGNLNFAGAGAAIQINASNVDLDGKGFTLTQNQNGQGTGIFVAGGYYGVKIRNVNVSGFILGIEIDGSGNTVTGNGASNSPIGVYVGGSNNTITGNSASNNATGIVVHAPNNTITGNTASSNTYYGIVLNGASSNAVSGNTTDNNSQAGIYLQSYSSGNQVRKNTASSNPYGIVVSDTSCINNILVSNTAQGNSQFDLWDASVGGPCHNGWASNTFVTDNETGIAAGPAYGCIR